jgi:hypothetical protein
MLRRILIKSVLRMLAKMLESEKIMVIIRIMVLLILIQILTNIPYQLRKPI